MRTTRKTVTILQIVDDIIEEMKEDEGRSYSNMVSLLLREAIETRLGKETVDRIKSR